MRSWGGKGRRVWALAGIGALLLAAVAAGLVLFKMNASKGPPGVPESSPPLRLLVPAYFFPDGEGLLQWNQLLNSPAAAATVAIVNLDNGPGAVRHPKYTEILKRAREKGVTVIGYVSTKYATRDPEEVKADVDRWIHFYPDVQGIFLDQQASAAEKIDYYTALYQHVHKKPGLGLVVTNPGTVCAEDYFSRPATDVACLAEPPAGIGKYQPPAWAGRYSAGRFAALATNVDTPEKMQGSILETIGKRIGYCYVTDGESPNPWSRLPRYWEQEAEAVRQVNAR
jgi:hypothetical protein